MAITVTDMTPNGRETKVFHITSTLDADLAAGPFAHGLKSVPVIYTVTPLQAQGVTAGWYVSAVDDTAVTLTKKTTAGTGVAGAQVQLCLTRPVTANA